MKFNSLLFCIAALVASISAQTNEMTIAQVAGDRVSLRAHPTVSSDLLERAMRGEEMVYMGKTNGWVAVQAPDSLTYYVAGEYIKDGKVAPEKLNVRSGPSLNYTVVGVVNKGDAVEVRGEFNDWLKIAPPAGCQVWVSEKYVDIIEPPKPEPVPLPAAEPIPVVEEPVRDIEPMVVEQEVPAPKPELPTLVLVLDKTRAQGTNDEIPGVLRRANPGLYHLVLIMDGFEEPICFVRGKEAQMERYLNRSMLIKGKKYWAKGIDLPILQPEKIHLDPMLSE